MSAYVWVVEQGTYSDYRVVGVFSSRKNAQLVADAINAAPSHGYDEAKVDKWRLDPAVAELNAGLKPHIVHMLVDGTVKKSWQSEISSYQMGGSSEIWRRTQAPAYRGKGIPDILVARIWAESDKHAIKIANEIRARMIAEGKW